MRAVVGDDPELWKPLPSYFTPGTPVYTEDGGDILKGSRRYEEAKRLLAEAGYKGEKVALVDATDVAITKAQGNGRHADARRLQRGLHRHGLGHGGPAPRQEGASGAGRLEHLPHLARRCRLHQPGAVHRAGRRRRPCMVRLAQVGLSAGGDRRLVRVRRSTTRRTGQLASSCNTRPGAGTSAEWSRRRSRCSGACRRARARPCSPTSSAACSRPSR